MRLITITLQAAFRDWHDVSADAIADRLVEHLQNLEADVAFTTRRDDRDVEAPEETDTDEQIQQWQEIAIEALDAWTAE
jgi:hypothetical protein